MHNESVALYRIYIRLKKIDINFEENKLINEVDCLLIVLSKLKLINFY